MLLPQESESTCPFIDCYPEQKDWQTYYRSSMLVKIGVEGEKELKKAFSQSVFNTPNQLM